MKRAVILALIALSTLTFLAASALWVRSYWVMDSVQLASARAGDGGVHTSFVGLTTARAVDEVGIATGVAAASDVAEGAQRSLRSYRGGRLIFNSMKGTLAERLGFRLASGPSGFIRGLMARSATHTIVNFPLWAVCLVTALPGALCVAHRRRRRSRARAGRCQRCGYDLRASPERCPECGGRP